MNNILSRTMCSTELHQTDPRQLYLEHMDVRIHFLNTVTFPNVKSQWLAEWTVSQGNNNKI